MGNAPSTPTNSNLRGFPGSAILDNMQCGAIDDAEEAGGSPKSRNGFNQIYSQAETLCAQSSSQAARVRRAKYDDQEDVYEEFGSNLDDEDEEQLSFNVNARNQKILRGQDSDEFQTPSASAKTANPTSALFARALVNEVTDNPKTMTPAAMAERERRLLKAQDRAKVANKDGPRPVGAPGGIGTPSVFGSLAHALTGSTEGLKGVQDITAQMHSKSVLPPNSLSENRAQVGGSSNSITAEMTPGKHTVTIGLSLSRRHSTVGHPDTVTRQTAFDFNELQDRQYKYVSSTDSSGWRAGGGERGGPQAAMGPDDDFIEEFGEHAKINGASSGKSQPSTPSGGNQNYKIAAPDTVHIPIIHIDAESPQAVDFIISSLARGELFIPHMAVLPEALSVNGISPPDLVVRFGTERNDDVPPDEWPNWCLEFMHNQLYEYFQSMGARWMKRPFSITLARKVRWKTVKHMNRYFAHAERVIDAWREKGPQFLDPQLAYIEGGATPEEVARPHGIYLLRNGVPTNYFAPNFDPPYTTKMTRSLLLNVLGKSWDKKRREWTSEPIPRLVTPTLLISTMCGCTDNTTAGFMANEVTNVSTVEKSHIPGEGNLDRSYDGMGSSRRQKHSKSKHQHDRNDFIPGITPVRNYDSGNDSRGKDRRDGAPVKSPTSSSPHSSRTRGSQQGSQSAEDSQHRREDSDRGRRRGPDPTSPGTDASDINDELEAIHLSSPRSGKGPKYGRAPTPEQLRFHSRSTEESQHSRRDPQESPTRYPRDPDAQHAEAVSNAKGNRIAKSGDVPASVTGTNSTIVATNLTTEHFMKREIDRRQAREEKKEEDVRAAADADDNMACDEDWFDDMSELVSDIDGERKRKQQQARDAIDKERSRQIALIAMAQEETSKAKDTLARTLQDPEKMQKAQAMMRWNDNGVKSPTKRHPQMVQRNDSGTSLEYSVDSTLIGDASTIGGSTLLGSHYATDTSVVTTSSRGSRRQQAQQQQQSKSALNSKALASSKADREEDTSAFTVQESSSSLDAVPTDEELFAVGWAKALDPRSGSYYYFTLDRTKIVWDNPLASRNGSMEESLDSPLPAGSTSI